MVTLTTDDEELGLAGLLVSVVRKYAFLSPFMRTNAMEHPLFYALSGLLYFSRPVYPQQRHGLNSPPASREHEKRDVSRGGF
jgi:hypothetical protein